MHLAPLIQDLAILLAVAAVVTLLFKRIRLPLILGYIMAGILVNPQTLSIKLIQDLPNISTWAELGVIFLMFSLGLEFSFHKLLRTGAMSSVTALFEMSLMATLGFFLGKKLGWSSEESIFLGATLTVSSTTIIYKSLDELRLKTHQFAQNIFSTLIAEDLFAILIMVGLTRFFQTHDVLVFSAGIELLFVMGSWFLVGYFVLPRIVKYFGRYGSAEMLVILATGLCLSFAVFATRFGYSEALGAFVIGSIIAESNESGRIERLIRPLRDIFAAIFFVSVGVLINPQQILEFLPEIFVITAVVILGKTLSISLGSLLTGRSLNASIRSGLGMAQIGEFSFIIAGLGRTLEVLPTSFYPIIVGVSLLTSFTTPLLVRLSQPIAERVESTLPQTLLEKMRRYALWIQDWRANPSLIPFLIRPLWRWILSALALSLIFVLTRRFLVPFLEEQRGVQVWIINFSWIVSTVLSVPFLWGMFFAFRIPNQSKTEKVPLIYHGATLASRIAAAVLLGILSVQYFSASLAIGVTGGIILILFFVFYQRIEKSYHWFENHFLSTFEEKKKKTQKKEALNRLAPWDAHLIPVRVHPQSPIVGKRIRDLNYRPKYGVNIVAIQRGAETLTGPGPSDFIYPHDELLFVGTDEKLDLFRREIESPHNRKNIRTPHALDHYALKPFKIESDSDLSEKTLKSARIREIVGGTVVGVERKNRRLTQFGADFKLQEQDILWIVKSQLDEPSSKG